MFRDPFRLYLSLAGGLSIAVEDAGGRCNAPGPRALWNLGDKLDQSQEMPTPRLYHSKRNGTREKNHGRSATRRASRLRHQIQDSVREDHVDTRSGKFAQSREPLDTRVKHSTHRCWKFAQGARVWGVGWGTHTNTAGRDVSGDHDGALSSLELVQDPVTLVLLLVAVNRCQDC